MAINPGYLIKDLAKLVRDTFPRSIQIDTAVARDLHAVRSDPTQVHQILLNLCVNARDAMASGGKLRIEAANINLVGKEIPGQLAPVSGPYVLLSVSDTGSGIPPELLDKVFEPFFTTKPADKGTGLGLSTVMSIVKNHGGFVEVFSRVGEGSSFKVYLPASPAAEIHPSPLKPMETPAGNGELILLVDDDRAVLEMTKETLKAFQYQVVVARDGGEALQIYRQRLEQVRLLITDLMMPVMDGPALIRKVLELTPGARVVCVSGLASASKLAELDRSQVVALLNKPFTTQMLLQTVRHALDLGSG
jgi:CheY-like chemotaxis protein